MPKGLYKDVVRRRSKFFYLYHTTSILRWILMVLQLCVSAALTALGSISANHHGLITGLGAAGTIIAGLLGLLHNSGLPERYRHDMMEYEGVEDHVRELLETGIAPADQSIDQVVAGCFELYSDAKATVTANMPISYTRINPRRFTQGTMNLPLPVSGHIGSLHRHEDDKASSRK